MKLGLIGDVHGNVAALRAVLGAAVRHGVEHLLITGDLVGYYFEPARVLELLAPWPKHIVRGNHEDMLCAARDDAASLAPVEAKYGTGLRVALETLSAGQVEELCRLPHPLQIEIGGRDIVLCHGSPWDNDFYVYPDAGEEVLARCAQSGADLVVLGHTHYPMVRNVGRTLVVNPGSVGQPRNRQPGAHWALYDTTSGEVMLLNEAYDFGALAEEARRRHPEIPFLSSVLERT